MVPRTALRSSSADLPAAEPATTLANLNCQDPAAHKSKSQVVDARAEAGGPWAAYVPDLATVRTCCFALGSALLGVLLVFLVHETVFNHSKSILTTTSSHVSQGATGGRGPRVITAASERQSARSPLSLRHARQHARLALLAEQLGNPGKPDSLPEPNSGTKRISQQVQDGTLPTNVKGNSGRSKLLEPGAAEETESRAWWQRLAGLRDMLRSKDVAAAAPKDGLSSEQEPHADDKPQGTSNLLPKEGHLELLAARNISANDPDACGKLLQIPKVAITFLTVGALHHEATWAAWFQKAAGAYPLASFYSGDCLGSTGMLLDTCTCDAELAKAADRVCAPRPDQPFLRQQHLFSVYIHRLPSTGDFPGDSIFAGREIAERIPVTWGTHEETEAAINMLRAALQDPLNQKFILLSESCLPLYPPAAVHEQLMAEDLSRMDACGMGDTSPWRYTARMGVHVHANWRKSFQWTSLTRKLAQLIVDDTEIAPIFKEFCRNDFDPDYMRWRDCFSTEHLFPTLIAYRQLGYETDCIGNLVSADWSQGGYHPKTYEPDDVYPLTFTTLRDGPEWEDSCKAASHLIRVSEEAYGRASAEPSATVSACNPLESLWRAYETAVMAPRQKIVGYPCPLFARKFSNETASAVFDLLTGCDNDLKIADSNRCRRGSSGEPEMHYRHSPQTRLLLGMQEV